MIMKSLLRDYILSHPDTWEKDLAAAPYHLKITRGDEDLIIFKYNQLESDFSNPIVREARGIIFDERNWMCVCRGFDKFGNYGESYVPDLDWGNCFVSEKIDGSLIKMYYYRGSWKIATNGTIDAYDAKIGDAKEDSYGSLFQKTFYGKVPPNLFKRIFTDIHMTYLFELVSPVTQVVVPWEEPDVYFLGGCDMTNGKILNFTHPWFSEIRHLLSTPDIYYMNTLESIQEAADALSWDAEGYVVCDSKGNRCKIKSPAYVRAHYLRANNYVNLSHLLDVINANEVEEFLIYAPEYADVIKKLKNYKEILPIWAEMYKNTILNSQFANKFECYLIVKQLNINKELQNFMLKVYDYPDYTWEQYTEKWDYARWRRCLAFYFV